MEREMDDITAKYKEAKCKMVAKYQQNGAELHELKLTTALRIEKLSNTLSRDDYHYAELHARIDRLRYSYILQSRDSQYWNALARMHLFNLIDNHKGKRNAESYS